MHNFPGLHNVVALRPAFQYWWRAAAARGIAIAKPEAANGYLYTVIGVEEPQMAEVSVATALMVYESGTRRLVFLYPYPCSMFQHSLQCR